MTVIAVVMLVIAVAVLAPRYGVDSRHLVDRHGGPPDLMPGPAPAGRCRRRTRPGGRPVVRR